MQTQTRMMKTMSDTQDKNKKNIAKSLLVMFPSLVKVIIMMFIIITDKIPPKIKIIAITSTG